MKKLTNELVIEKLKTEYGDKLIYSKVNYINSRNPITLICPTHGEFLLYANNALLGKGGCPLCKKTIPDRNTFIKLSNEKHNYKYNYDKVNFINGNLKVTIICPIHGEFELVARKHAIEGCECPKCAILSRSEKRTYTTKDFINKANKIHNNKYDYSKVRYVDSKTLVTIICPIHGEFLQRPNNHLLGLGCVECSREKVSNHNRMSLEDFINKGNKIHNNKYDYSSVKYRNTDKKIEITCPIHGPFWQSPHIHLLGSGCPECGKESAILKRSYTSKQFIEKANIIHNNFYDYNKTIYKNIYNKIIVTCPIHGDFELVPHDHLKGSGCPKCSMSKGEKLVSKCLDKIGISYECLKMIKVDYVVKNSNYFIVDFYININNKKYIIEYNGIQHYEYVPYLHNGNIIEFDKQKNRDKKLEEYCNLNNINLLWIKYDLSSDKVFNLIKSFIYENESKNSQITSLN